MKIIQILGIITIIFTLLGYLHIIDDAIPDEPAGVHPLIQSVKITAWLVWLFATIIAVSYVYGRKYKPRRSIRRTPVNTIIVTVATNKMKNVLEENINALKKFGFRPNILMDDGSELQEYFENRTDVDTIIVPKSYRRDLVGKGRAMNYAVESMDENEWYAFLDDDNVLLDDSFAYEIAENEKDGKLITNPVIVPREGRSKMTHIMDWIRYLDDLTIFRFFTGVKGKPLMGLHGELLCARGDVFKDVGFDEFSTTEDFAFSMRVVQKGYKTWQSETRVSVLSPHSIGDFMKQRSRWYWGIVRDLFTKKGSLLMKLFVGFIVFTWTIGIFASWLFAPMWLYWDAFYIAIPGGVLYTLVYLYGIKKSKNWRYVVLLPVYSIIEAVSWTRNILSREFVVIDKT